MKMEFLKKDLIIIMVIWLTVLVWFNIPSMDWTIGVFHSADRSLWVPSIYGIVINGTIYFGNIYRLIPNVLSKRDYGQYLVLLLIWFLGLNALESVLDLLWFRFFYEYLTREIVIEIVTSNLLLNFIFFLIPSFLHRFALDWFTSSEVQNNLSTETFTIKSGPETYQIKLSEILLIESDGNYVRFHLPNRQILSRDSLSQLENELPSQRFIRCHKSYIVNKEHIFKQTYDSLIVGETKVPIGRVYRERLKQHMSF